MATIRRYQDLEIWKRARALAKVVWDETQRGSFSKDYKLKDQINDATGSVMDNSAEGFGRGGSKEFKQFLSVSKGSCTEVGSQLHRALDREHLNEQRFTD